MWSLKSRIVCTLYIERGLVSSYSSYLSGQLAGFLGQISGTPMFTNRVQSLGFRKYILMGIWVLFFTYSVIK